MKLVLLSGGSGKRLWPLSNDSRSKQFLKVLVDEDGREESMIQRVWRQINSVDLAQSTMIATGKAQVDILQSQLGSEAKLLVEPDRRDTFPAIALAASYLYSVEDVDLNEFITIMPVDPYVQATFFSRIKELENVLLASHANLALIGVTPTHPSTKYGYIIPEQGDHLLDGDQLNSTNQGHAYMKVKQFKEKPDEEEAKQLLQLGAFWNCGVFSFKLHYIISLLVNKGFPLDYEELLKNYDQLPKISFDYEIVEKEDNIVILPYEGEWKDLGTWNVLTEEMDAQTVGNAIISKDCNNTHIVNELEIPIVAVGLTNTVVVASPDGILVSEKEASIHIKKYIHTERRPMYEERRWGWYRVLDYFKDEEGKETLTKRICIKAGKNLSYQLHHKRSEIWTIIKGKGELALEDEIISVKSGDVIKIPQESPHGIKAVTDLEFIEVQTGSELVEEDIIRILMDWEKTRQFCLKRDEVL